MLNEFFYGDDGGGPVAPTGVRSLRFNRGDSPYLQCSSFGTPTNTDVCTASLWIKRANGSSPLKQYILDSGGLGSLYMQNASGGDRLRWDGAANFHKPGREYDAAAWMHILLVQYSSTSREMFINGLSANTISDNGQLGGSGAWTIGGDSVGGQNFKGLIADIYFIDGQALAPGDFTEFDSNGDLQPKAYTGTFGNNGFHLDFSDNTNTTTIGQDSSGNGYNFTANNISVTAGAGNDSLVDSPSRSGTDTGAGGEVFGNYATLDPYNGSPSGLSNANLDAASANAYPTIIPETGQWYYEVDGTGYTWDGTFANWTPRAGSHNFGQRPFSSTATSGHKALCSTNLADPTIIDSTEYVNTAVYTGDSSSSNAVTGLGFEPDLLWFKSRAGRSPYLVDAVRGGDKLILTSSGSTEATNSNAVQSFDADGFTVGSDNNFNASAESIVSWAWYNSGSDVSNTDGSITSSVRADTTAGFSIVTYTGTGASATVGHGLGAAPEVYIIKNRNATTTPRLFTTVIDGSLDQFVLNSTNGKTDSAITLPTSTVFSLDSAASINTSGDGHIAYCWTSIPGFSQFGSYTGNGSADGPLINLGFRPAIVYIKNSTTNSVHRWYMSDSKRDGVNDQNYFIATNDTNAEITNSQVMFLLSNGFKINTSNQAFNQNSISIFYAAWAEDPFKTALAR